MILHCVMCLRRVPPGACEDPCLRAYSRPRAGIFPRDLLLQVLNLAVQAGREALTTERCRSERLVNEASEARTQTDKVGAWSMRALGRAQRRFACVVQAVGEQQQQIHAVQQQVGRRLYSGLIFVHLKPLLVIAP